MLIFTREHERFSALAQLLRVFSHLRLRMSVRVEIVNAGDGKSYPVSGSNVTVDYHAFLQNGTKWDSSIDRGKPLTFKLGAEQVISGLDEGVSQLSKGERAKITIPPGRAYADQGFPGLVPPNATLIFDLTLKHFDGQ